MTELVFVVAASIFLVYLMPRYYSSDKEVWRTYGYGKGIMIILFLLMAGFIGLRLKMNDTYAYRKAYEQMLKFPDILENYNWTMGNNPGFVFVNSLLKAAGFSAQSFLMFYSLVTNGLYLLFLRKYSCNLTMSLFLFVMTGVYTFTGAAVKQSLATAIALFAVGCAIEKKWGRFLLLILLAMTFHPYVMVYLCVPFLFFKPGTKKTYFLLGGTVLAAFLMQRYLGVLLSVTESFGDSYSAEEFSQEGVNIFRLLVCNAPLFLVFLIGKEHLLDSTETEAMMVNLTIMNGAIMFLGLFGTANYFARLANFFLCTQAITIPYLLEKMEDRTKKIVTLVAVGGYLLYFVYENVLLYPFEVNFRRMGMWEYLLHNVWAS